MIHHRDFPKEIRLMIIEVAVEEVTRIITQERRQEGPYSAFQAFRRSKPLAPLSGVDIEWNRVIEMRLFNSITITPSDLAEFAKYCNKRHGRLNTIRLEFMHEEVDVGVQPEYFVGHTISKLLDTMHHWNPQDRERNNLLKVQIDIWDMFNASVEFNISHGLGVLPQVPIVEALYELPRPEGGPLLHPSSSLALYRALPNVRHAGLNLRLARFEHLSPAQNAHISLAQIKNHIFSLGAIYPNLTRLHLLPDAQKSIRNNTSRWGLWAPGTDCFAAFPPSWHNTLVRLDLKQVKDLPGFLAAAGQVNWPHLKTLVLLGEVESHEMSHQQRRVMNEVTGTALIRGLVALIPNTPKLTTVLFEMVDFGWNWNFGSFRIQMCLGNLDDVEASFGLSCSFAPCSYSFVPTQDIGTMVVSSTKVSGEVATELQRTVQIHHRKDLAVFFHYLNQSIWGRGLCRQWDAEKGNWDSVFENEADELIYHMGRYFDLAEP